jgi:PAS domain S-box-containing protein
MNQREDRSLDQALAHTGDGAFVVDAAGRITAWNRSAERILGHTAREVVGRACCDLFAGRDDDGNRVCYRGCHVMNLVKMGDPVQSFDMHTRAKSGRPVCLNISTLVAPNGPSGPTTVHLFRDVTATKDVLRLVQQRLASPVPAPLADDGPLTKRELEVLRLLASGTGTKAAAESLHVSPVTVRNHVQSIFRKLGVHSRLEAVARATQQRLL